jgi:hypothetical protein
MKEKKMKNQLKKVKMKVNSTKEKKEPVILKNVDVQENSNNPGAKKDSMFYLKDIVKLTLSLVDNALVLGVAKK